MNIRIKASNVLSRTVEIWPLQELFVANTILDGLSQEIRYKHLQVRNMEKEEDVPSMVVIDCGQGMDIVMHTIEGGNGGATRLNQNDRILENTDTLKKATFFFSSQIIRTQTAKDMFWSIEKLCRIILNDRCCRPRLFTIKTGKETITELKIFKFLQEKNIRLDMNILNALPVDTNGSVLPNFFNCTNP